MAPTAVLGPQRLSPYNLIALLITPPRPRGTVLTSGPGHRPAPVDGLQTGSPPSGVPPPLSIALSERHRLPAQSSPVALCWLEGKPRFLSVPTAAHGSPGSLQPCSPHRGPWQYLGMRPPKGGRGWWHLVGKAMGVQNTPLGMERGRLPPSREVTTPYSQRGRGNPCCSLSSEWRPTPPHPGGSATSGPFQSPSAPHSSFRLALCGAAPSPKWTRVCVPTRYWKLTQGRGRPRVCVPRLRRQPVGS